MENYEDDYLERIFVARTRGWILALTEQGHCHFLSVLDVPEGGRASRGQSVYALLEGADRKDRIVSTIPVADLTAEERYLLFVSRKGVVKRTPLSDFSNPRSGGVKAAGVKKGDGILDVVLSDGTAEVMLLARGGRAIRFPEDQISVVGRTAQGVKGVALKGKDEVAGMLLIRRDSNVLTVSEDGLGKRTPVSEFPLQSRGGMGTLAAPAGSASPIVAALEVLEADEVMIVTARGGVLRAAVDSVPVQGRRTQGKRLAPVERGDRVVEVTRAEGGGGGPARGPVGADGEDQLDLLGS
jgi:DNA gyrase subunit A